MAFQKVTLTPEEEAALQGSGSNFFKFIGVGSKLIGRFVKTQAQIGQYAKKDLLDYVFRVPKRDESGAAIPGQTEEVTVNTTRELNAKLAKCNLQVNWPVKITVTGEEAIAGYSNPVKHFDVEFDPSPGTKAAPPPPPPKPAVSGNADDLDF